MRRLTVHLNVEDYRRLVRQAAATGQPPAFLVRPYVQQGLGTENTPEKRWTIAKEFADLRKWARQVDIRFDPIAVIRKERERRP